MPLISEVLVASSLLRGVAFVKEIGLKGLIVEIKSCFFWEGGLYCTLNL